jgi:thiol:disulfide interchange protein DsbD
LSIIIIYVALGLLITLAFGASALNEAASSATFNLLFFALLIIFAMSFLGAFEITLPSA